MSYIGIYKIALTNPKLGITKDLLATRIIPYLIPISIDNNLNMSLQVKIFGKTETLNVR